MLVNRVAKMLGNKADDFSLNYSLGLTSTNLDSSLYYFNRALARVDTTVDPNEAAYVYSMIGRKYRNQYEWTSGDTSYITTAHKWFLKALEVPGIDDYTKAGIYFQIVSTSHIIDSEENIAKTDLYLQKVITLSENWTGKNNIAYKAYELLGYATQWKGDVDKAVSYFKQSILLAEERLADFSVMDYREPMRAYEDKHMIKITKASSYEGIFKSYSWKCDFWKAMDYLDLTRQAEEEIYLEQNRNMITLMEAVSKDEKSKSQMELLARDNELKALAIKQSRMLIFGIAGIFVILLLFGLLMWRQNKLKNENKNKILKQKLLHDLELKQVESDKLKEMDQLKSRFFANVSHEFRTPLTLIMGPLERVLTKTHDNRFKKELGMAKKHAGILQKQINNLLTISKLESGKMQLFASETNVVKLIKSYFQAFESLAKQKNITLNFISDSEEIKAFIDREKFEQVLNNLFSNAFKFTEEGGSIEVFITPLSPPSPLGVLRTREEILPTVVTNQSVVEIKVTDTGCGVPPEHINHIFDRFYQVENKNGGTGIGLALTREMVELHYGTITVESEPDTGSTFTLLLPLGNDHLKPEEIEVDAPTHQTSPELIPGLSESFDETETVVKETLEANNNKAILLIVEDNTDMRSYIREYFETDYQIIEAVDGSDGFDKATINIPDIIISDVMMPKMDGNELCSKLKTNESTSHIPVILLTAKASSESKIEGLETGADDFITKPFDGKELQVRVKNLVEQRDKVRRLLESKIKKSHSVIQVDFADSGITSMDEQFMQKVFELLKEHHSNPEFSIHDFGQHIGLSVAQLNRKIKALTGQSSGEFIRTFRLTRAAELIKKKSGTITEIAYDVGFSSPSYFSECFKAHFGKMPSDFTEND